MVIGLGGINPAGRVSFHHAYRRLVIDALNDADADATYASLAGLMRLEGDSGDRAVRQYILDNTLVRRIANFDPNAVVWQRSARLRGVDNDPLSFAISKNQLPARIPDNWTLHERDDGKMQVTTPDVNVLLPDHRVSRVSSGGEVPTGFEPGELYQSRNHPRGLQLTIYGASDAVRSIGMDWGELKKRVRPDEFAVYSGSAMGQMDYNGSGGVLQAPMMGRRTTSKQVALGLCEMPADFINAYIIGSVGSTGAVIGACATFLYNLKQAVAEIRAGKRRVALVGGAEAPVTPEIVEAYRTMGALAEDGALMALDGGTESADNRRACRPFSSNAGFTLAEAAVYTVLVDDELALELGANIYGAVADVFVNADGFKKSIPSPGVGNYVTVAKALGLARSILGETAVRQRSYMHAHGTGTPQNRVSESHILNEIAKTFGIERWPVAAVKAYLGHTLAPASADQLACAFGAWTFGIIPGIKTIDHVADDVHASNLRIGPEHIEIGDKDMDVAFINSKGFGGNNATGVVLAPHVTYDMLRAKHGDAAIARHAKLNETVQASAAAYDTAATNGEVSPIYQFGEGVLDGDDIELSEREIRVPGYEHPISLEPDNPFPDMTRR